MSDIKKSESSDPKFDFNNLPQEVGQPYIVDGYGLIQEEKKKALKYPKAFCTIKEMLRDADIANASDSVKVKALQALEKGVVKAKKSKKSEEAANFLNYAIRNISHGTWQQAMANACTCLDYGFALINPVFEVRNYGRYSGKVVLKKLAPRNQSSIYGWAWDKKGRDLKGAIQKPMKTAKREPSIGDYTSSKIMYSSVSSGYYKDPKYTFLSINKLLHFKFNPVDENPQGTSPLFLCYDSWAEKSLIEQYEICGVSKDLGGIAVVSVPLELMQKAAEPQLYPEDATQYKNILDNAAAAQQGKNQVVVVASDIDDQNKNRLYDFKLQGIEGGGKQYKTSEIIEQKRKSIYNVFGAAFMITGQSGHGSNALSSNQMTTHDYYVQRLIMWITDVINSQLLPRLLRANNMELDWDDMPYFEPEDPTKDNAEVVGKLVNRLAQGGALTNKALERAYELLEFPTEGVLDLDLTKNPSGEFEGSGNGTTQAGGASSDTNN
jgi:hypothetical protein